jgi:hypothetical protein
MPIEEHNVMITFRRWTSAAILSTAVALSFGGCGASDEEEIRAVAKEFNRLDAKDAERACELITTRAEAQLTAFVADGGNGDCVKALQQVEQSDEQPTPGEIDKAVLKIRDDRAVLNFDEQPLGLRKVDGDWQIDNLFNARLVEEARHFPAALSRGSDEQQVRASMNALVAAYRKRDYDRACDLLSYGAEAQLFVALAFASFADTEASDKPPTDTSCASMHRRLARIIGKKGGFAADTPSVTRIAAAKVAIRGDRATVRLASDDSRRMIRQDGHWLMDADEEGISVDDDPPSPGSLERCWKRAGAQIASSGKDLRFAIHGTVKAVAIKSGLVSVKGVSNGVGWRVFYTLPADGVDPGLRVLRKPRTVRAVAYVRDAKAHPRVVNRARACGS